MSKAQLKIVEACEETQFLAMSEIHSLGWRDTYPGFVPDDYLQEVCTAEHWAPEFRENYELGESFGLLLYHNDTPAGCIIYGAGRAKNAVGCENFGEIRSFYVHPDFRSLGYGEKLMQAALAKLKDAGHENAFVLVLKENEGARRFYTRCGFAWDGTEIDIPFPHDYHCTDLRYVRPI